MTLRELLHFYPTEFYPQTWYVDEPFVDIDVGSATLTPPPTLLPIAHVPRATDDAPPVALMAALYIAFPDHPMWRNYLWCAETDSLGQRIYVGSNGHGFEIHRHIHLTKRFVLPLWA